MNSTTCTQAGGASHRPPSVQHHTFLLNCSSQCLTTPHTPPAAPQLLLSYHPFWLWLGLETVVGRTVAAEVATAPGRGRKLARALARYNARLAEAPAAWQDSLPAFIQVCG